MALAPPAAAHKGHSTLTVVEVDAASGAVTVTHQMAAHDAEPALVFIAPDAQPNLDDEDALKALVAYVGRSFTLRDADGARVPLALKRSDLDGDDVRLVFEGRLKPPAQLIGVDSRIFADVHPDEENLVNVHRLKVTRSATFTAGSDAQVMRFD